MSHNYNKYLTYRLIFNNEFQNDYISPIFEQYNNDSIIGFCYKINSYIKINDYSKYLLNGNLIKIIKLYIYYKIFKNNIIKDHRKLYHNYYLINRNIINEFKNDNKYEEIKQQLNNVKQNEATIENIYNDNNLFNNSKNLYSLIKSLNPDINIEFNKTKNNEKNFNDFDIKPNKKQINYIEYNNKEVLKSIYINDNFEILDKTLIQLLTNKSINEKNFEEIDIINNYIMINYPKDNNQYISVIGEIDDDNKFIQKYILIYYDEKNRNNHISLLKKYLDNYLKGITNNGPIINDKYEIIGNIIIIEEEENLKLNKNNDDKNIKNDNKGEIKQLESLSNEMELKNDEEKTKNQIENLNELNNKILNLQNELNQKSIDNKKLNEEINKLKRELNEQNNNNKNLRNEVQKIKESFSKEKDKNKQLYNDLEIKANDLKNENEKLKGKIKELEEDKKKYNNMNTQNNINENNILMNKFKKDNINNMNNMYNKININNQKNSRSISVNKNYY